MSERKINLKGIINQAWSESKYSKQGSGYSGSILKAIELIQK